MNTNKIKLVITHPSQLIPRTVEYFCLDKLALQFDLEYWDCSAIVYPAFNSPYKIERDYCKIIESLAHFKLSMERLPTDTLLISAVDDNSYNFGFHKIQSTYIRNKIFVDFFHMSYDVEDKSPSLIKQTIRFAKSKLYGNESLRGIIKWLFHHSDPQWKDKQVVEILRHKYRNTYVLSNYSDSEYRINHPDYETFLAAEAILNNQRYVVFLDQYYPYHPEFKYIYSDLELEKIAVNYYRSLNAFFSKIEKYYDCKVIIAAHPYADYSKNPFEGRMIFTYKSAELVKYSYAVCMHSSCAISFAMLADKPLCIMTCEAWEARDVHNVQEYMENYARRLSIPLTNIDKLQNIENVFSKVPNSNRTDFIQKYLYDMVKPQTNYNLFISHLNNIYHEINGNEQ